MDRKNELRAIREKLSAKVEGLLNAELTSEKPPEAQSLRLRNRDDKTGGL
ncbi:hypothetical protein VFC49_00790 [Thermococcus sp. SY098]|nr:hypothetical protein [Thermococcus sp. SY098]WRS52741.1 hypothetical protein VFC49_00790 [Thermococcus sp. SY098]